MQLREALAQGTHLLENARIASPRLTAEVLLMQAVHCDRAHLFGHPERELTDGERVHYGRYLTERLEGKPTQYITGHQEFWGMDFVVNPSVLIPRPETELVVETALEIARARFAQPPALRIADVGTGSGCLAVALAAELPASIVYALDSSPDALETACMNARRNGVEDTIRFIRSDLLNVFCPEETNDLRGREAAELRKGTTSVVPNRESEAGASAPEVRVPTSAAKAASKGVSSGMSEARPSRLPSLHIVVSNPPYIGQTDREGLPREVREFEPPAALFAGESGGEVYSRLIPQAAQALLPGGYVVLELGYDSKRAVSELLHGPEWADVCWKADLAGITRVVFARRAGHRDSEPESRVPLM